MIKAKLAKASSSTNFEHNPKKTKLSDQTETVSNFNQTLLRIQLDLNSELKNLKFAPPVAFVYNPLEYAFRGYETYVSKYCGGCKKVLFVGMNPGPFGMCQTGVPFGEINSVQNWLGIRVEVTKPEIECPKRPVLGFGCKRKEISGARFWGLCEKLFGTPEKFFEECWVFNYCPLALMKNDGGNLTPRDIKDHKQLEKICDSFYVKVIELLQPQIIVGIGEYAEKRTHQVLKLCQHLPAIKILRLPHPSPRSVNNQNWSEKAQEFFKTHDLLKLC